MTALDHIDQSQSKASTGKCAGIEYSVKDAYPCKKEASIQTTSNSNSSRIEKYSEGWSLSYTNDKLTTITYPSGKKAEISYADGEVSRVKLPDNTFWAKKGKHSALWYEGNIKSPNTLGCITVYDDGRITSKNWKTAIERTWYADGTSKIGMPDLAGNEFKHMYLSALPQIDSNKDGRLSKTELKNAILNPSVKGEAARFAAIAHRCFDDLSSLAWKRPGTMSAIEKGDIDVYAAYCGPTADSYSELLGHLNHTKDKFESIYQRFVVTDERNRHRNLYSHADSPNESIRPKFVKQGSLWDCYFHASLASVADARPDLIKKMIHDNRDGTYTVTFAGAANQPWRIQSLTESEKMIYGSSTEGGLWPLVIEKAYGEQLRKEYGNMGLGALVDDMLPYQLTNIAGLSEQVLDKITGQQHDTMFMPMVNDNDLGAALKSACDQHIPMTCGSKLADIRPRPQGLDTHHAYSILKYDSDKHLVTIRNPHGVNEETYQGTFQMTLEQLRDNFTDVYFAWRPKRGN